MTEPGKKTKNHRSKRVRRIVLTLILLALTAFVIFRLTLKAKINSRLKAIRAQGYPVTFTELEEYYSIPDAVENGAETILQALSNLRPSDGFLELVGAVSVEYLCSQCENTRQGAADEIRRELQTNAACLRLLHERTQSEYWRYPLDNTGEYILAPYLGEIGTAAHLLKLKVIFEVENSNVEAAIDALLTGLRLAESLAVEPTYPAHSRRMLTKRGVLSQLQYAVNELDLADAQIEILANELGAAEDLDAMHQTFIGERCEGVAFFTNLRANDLPRFSNSWAPSLKLAAYKISGWKDRDFCVYLDLIEQAMQASIVDSEDRLDAFEYIGARMKSMYLRPLLMPLWVPMLTMSVSHDLGEIARLRCAQTALAIERYRLANGRIPERLSDLVPGYLEAVPEDPFDGKELRYKKLEPGYVVYSVGKDLEDQGGLSKDGLDDRNDPHDWPFRILK